MMTTSCQRLGCLLLAVAFLICCTSPKTVQAATHQPSLMHLLGSDPQLSLWAALVHRFPDVGLVYANPNTIITAFLPNNEAVIRYLGGASYWDTLYDMYGAFDVVNPGGDTQDSEDNGAPAWRRYMWKVLKVHSLANNTILKLKDMAKGPSISSAMIEYGQAYDSNDSALTAYPMDIRFLPRNSSRAKQQLYAEEAFPVSSIIKGDIKAGKSVAHIIDVVMQPTVAPYDDFDDVLEFCPEIKDIAQVAKDAGFDIDAQGVPLTFFCPVNGGSGPLDLALKARGITRAQLLSNTTACISFMKAHAAISGTASASGLYSSDLYAMAGMNAMSDIGRALWSRRLQPQPLVFLNNNSAIPSVDLRGMTAGPVILHFNTTGSVKRVYAYDYDWGGNTIGFGPISIGHYVTEVLPF